MMKDSLELNKKIIYDKYLSSIPNDIFKQSRKHSFDLSYAKLKAIDNCYFHIFQERMKNNKYRFLELTTQNRSSLNYDLIYVNNKIKFLYRVMFENNAINIKFIINSNKQEIYNIFKFKNFYKAAEFLINENDYYLCMLNFLADLKYEDKYSLNNSPDLKKNFHLSCKYTMTILSSLIVEHYFNPNKNSYYYQ